MRTEAYSAGFFFVVVLCFLFFSTPYFRRSQCNQLNVVLLLFKTNYYLIKLKYDEILLKTRTTRASLVE